MGASPSKETPGQQQQDEEHKTLGSSLLDSAGHLCGSTNDTVEYDDQEQAPKSTVRTLLQKADAMCISSPKNEPKEQETPPTLHPTSALLARALVNEVTDNPRTMPPAAMAERERKLLKAQEAARKQTSSTSSSSSTTHKPVGAMGQPHVVASLAHALTGDDASPTSPTTHAASVVPPNALLENRAQVNTPERNTARHGTHCVTIGLSLSRRHSSLGHPDTVTRQTAFDFNELQDRQYKFVSSTDASGWMAGGGERGGTISTMDETTNNVTSMLTHQGQHKLAAPDTVHIPIITIDAESQLAVNAIVTALARGEVFIPHMSILPEALSVNGVSPPDLVVRFGCERNDDVPPEEWPNWCLEFMHNQLYEYFQDQGAQWSPRPFQITLAKKVRWKTVKHMNRYFAHAERVIDAWREEGPQYLDPQLSYIEGGATPEEVARPHGIYLFKNGIATNYFAPNFEPPYTTKMTRSLLMNVLDKSWDKKRREWTSIPVPRLVTPTMLVASMCGCTDANQGGFMANQATTTTVVGTPKRVTAIPSWTAREEEEEEEQHLVDVSMSNKSGASTKVSSVQLNPHEDVEDGIPRPLLEATMEDEDSSLEEVLDNVKPTRVDEKTRGGVGRYGSSPTPEMGVTRFKNENPRVPTPERPRLPTPTTQLRSPMVSPNATPSEATTVQHMNRTLERTQGLTLQAEGIEESSSSTENLTPKSSSSTPSKKKKKSKNKVKDAYEKERARQIAMIALAQQETIKETRGSNGALSEKNGNMPTYKMETAPSPKRADSGSVSLEYSIDSSSMLGDTSTLAGQFIGDASVGTAASRRRAKMLVEEEESTTSTEVVPTDEELFAVGWAKALDPKSGSYYYFTLDRSKIVWENPLAPEDGHANESSSVPAT